MDGRENLMDVNTDKTNFFIRVETLFLELADAQIRNGTVRSRTNLIEDVYRY